jgi:hypothetical protein
MSHADGKTNWPPRPGIDGTYRDTCMVCMRATDTALAFRGEGEFVVAGLICLGVPHDDAMRTVEKAPNLDDVTMTVRVCARCVAKASAPFPPPKLILEGHSIPLVAQSPQHLGEGGIAPYTP